MCGRYTLHHDAKKLARALALAIPDDYSPDYNIGPGREVLAIARTEEGTTARMMHWGLKTPQNFHINARMETVDTAPRFRESWASHRCLVPANGFYEWYADGVTKKPYYIYPEDRDLAYLAGLWYPADRPGQPATCLLLTTEAGPPVRQIHHRMPLLLPEDLHPDWLSQKLPKAEAIRAAEAVPFAQHPVSRRVNRVQNNDSALIAPATPQSEDQMMLF